MKSFEKVTPVVGSAIRGLPPELVGVEGEPSQATAEMQVALVDSELVVGQNRFAVGLLDPKGQNIREALVHFHFYSLVDPANPAVGDRTDFDRISLGLVFFWGSTPSTLTWRMLSTSWRDRGVGLAPSPTKPVTPGVLRTTRQDSSSRSHKNAAGFVQPWSSLSPVSSPGSSSFAMSPIARESPNP